MTRLRFLLLTSSHHVVLFYIGLSTPVVVNSLLFRVSAISFLPRPHPTSTFPVFLLVWAVRTYLNDVSVNRCYCNGIGDEGGCAGARNKGSMMRSGTGPMSEGGDRHGVVVRIKTTSDGRGRGDDVKGGRVSVVGTSNLADMANGKEMNERAWSESRRRNP
eukprot:768131-Hanusia_phi.AAC.3